MAYFIDPFYLPVNTYQIYPSCSNPVVEILSLVVYSGSYPAGASAQGSGLTCLCPLPPWSCSGPVAWVGEEGGVPENHNTRYETQHVSKIL